MADRWSAARTDALRRLFADGMPVAKIGAALDPPVTRHSVENRVRVLGLRRTVKCLICRGLVEREVGSRAMTCSRACYVVLMQAHKERRNALRRDQRLQVRSEKPAASVADPPHDPCRQCRDPVIRRVGETAQKFRRRKCCCQRCSEAYRVQHRRATMAARPAKPIAVKASVPSRAALVKQAIPIGDNYQDAVARFIAANGVTRAPPAFAAPSQHAALVGAEADRRIAAIEIPEPVEWKTTIWRNGL